MCLVDSQLYLRVMTVFSWFKEVEGHESVVTGKKLQAGCFFSVSMQGGWWVSYDLEDKIIPVCGKSQL